MKILIVGTSLVVTVFFVSACQMENRSAVAADNGPVQKEFKSRRGTAGKSNVNRLAEIEPSYIGCWRGMNGGQINITRQTISDLGSKELSGYAERHVLQTPVKGIETGERYLLEVERDFPKGFLATFILVSFNKDGTAGFVTFDSYEDYSQNKRVGQGLFEKAECPEK